jgi:DNA-binding winged helix-turn-helix (wHTH) protein/Tfp pilus assembly protein PilF
LPQQSQTQRLRFGVFEVNLPARELRKHGIRVRLPGQPFCILSILLEEPGEVITREEIRQRLWSSDTFVDFEHSLNSAVKKLRAALNDTPENSRYIETIPRVGYRFIAPVEEISPVASFPDEVATGPVRPAASPSEKRIGKHPWKILFATVVILLLVSSAYFAWFYFRSDPKPQTKMGNEARSASTASASFGPDNRSAASPKSAEAHDLYLKGMYYWNKRTVAGLQQAIQYFQQATTLDPNYALAYAGLANSYTLLTAYTVSSGTLYIPQARAAALRALQLDGNLAEAHTALALIVQNHDWDWKTSDKEFERAIALSPNYATAHQWYAEHLMWLGRFDEALRESQKAMQLDPLSLIIATDHGAILFYSRQYDRAIEQFRAVLQKDPNFPRARVIESAYVEKGMFRQALAQAEVTRRVYGDGPAYWAELVYVYGRAGQTDRARTQLEKLEKWSRQEQVDPAFLSFVHLAAGNKEEALADLEKAYSEHYNILTNLKVDPLYDPLRSDPRFQDLLRRVGLADPNTNEESKSTSRPPGQ